MLTKIDQMQLSLQAQARKTATAHRRTRAQRDAQWWFRQMRQVVDMAIEWKPTQQPEPVQGQFALGGQS